MPRFIALLKGGLEGLFVDFLAKVSDSETLIVLEGVYRKPRKDILSEMNNMLTNYEHVFAARFVKYAANEPMIINFASAQHSMSRFSS